MTLNRSTATLATVAGTLAVAGALVAGPTTPPSGPIAPTHKTLTEIEPRTSVQSLPGDAILAKTRGELIDYVYRPQAVHYERDT